MKINEKKMLINYIMLPAVFSISKEEKQDWSVIAD